MNDKSRPEKNPAVKPPVKPAPVPAPSKPVVAASPGKAEPEKTHLLSQWKYARPLTACYLDPLGRYVFTGAEDNLVQRWKLTDGTSTPLAAHDSWVRAIGSSPDGITTVTGGYDGRLAWWSTAADKPVPLRIVEAHAGWIRALRVSLDGQLVATCGNDKLVKLWDLSDGKLVRELSGHASHVYNLAFHPSGEYLASCDLKGVVKQWDLRSGKVVRELSAATLYKYDTGFRADIGGARSVAFSRDGKLLAIGGITKVQNAFAGIGNPAVVVLDWESGKPQVEHTGKESVKGVAWGVVQHADGYWIGLASGGGGGWIFFWHTAEQNEFFKFKLPDNGRDLALHTDGLRLVVAHADGNVRLYQIGRA